MCHERRVEIEHVGKVFTGARLAGAVVDRLTFHSLIVETGTESFRLRATTPSRKRKPPQTTGDGNTKGPEENCLAGMNHSGVVHSGRMV